MTSQLTYQELRHTTLFIALLSCIHVTIGQTSLNQINLENGNYQVGFKHYLKFDSTRTYIRYLEWTNTHSYRPIPVSVWYPANENSSILTPMRVLDYMDILKEEEEWEHLPKELILDWFP